jgi:hypothetical protein
MPKPDKTEKSDTGPEERAEIPTASASAKPAAATSLKGSSTIKRLRDAVLTGCGIGFFYAVFRDLNIWSVPTFWWLVSASTVVLIFAILRRRLNSPDFLNRR